MKVDVYWNLHKKCWSVRHKGKVIEHTLSVCLKDVQWVVQPAGNARVRQEGRKNVHAFARGTIIDPNTYWDLPDDTTLKVGIKYNPYINKCFVTKTINQPVTKSKYAALTTTYTAHTNSYQPIAIAHISPPWSLHDN